MGKRSTKTESKQSKPCGWVRDLDNVVKNKLKVQLRSSLGQRFSRSKAARAKNYLKASREGKEQIRMKWAQEVWQKRRTTYEQSTASSKEQGINDGGDWVPYKQIVDFYGSNRLASNYIKSAESRGWKKKCENSGATLYKLLKCSEFNQKKLTSEQKLKEETEISTPKKNTDSDSSSSSPSSSSSTSSSKSKPTKKTKGKKVSQVDKMLIRIKNGNLDSSDETKEALIKALGEVRAKIKKTLTLCMELSGKVATLDSWKFLNDDQQFKDLKSTSGILMKKTETDGAVSTLFNTTAAAFKKKKTNYLAKLLTDLEKAKSLQETQDLETSVGTIHKLQKLKSFGKKK